MNRTDRLYAITEVLRRVGPAGVTAARLAKRFEVSTRTIKRDISSLQQTGALIWSQPGPGGGYVLDGSASLQPVAFTPSQAVALATAVASLPSGSPFAVDAHAASAKLFDTLSKPSQERTRSLSQRIWVLAQQPEQATPAVVLRAVECSLVDHLALSIEYRDANQIQSKRLVEPIIVAWTDGRWYLVAHCQLRDSVRWFRFDRIETAAITRVRYQQRPTTDIGTPSEGAGPVTHCQQ